MHLRRLTLVSLAAPFLFAACSSDNSARDTASGVQGTGSTPDQTMGGLQPGEMGGGAAGSASGASEGQGTDIPLQPSTVPLGTVENRGSGCEVAALPPGNTLPMSPNLPDPFTKLDGTRISKKSDWVCRRQEILKQAYQYIYGEKPPKPDSVTGTVSDTQVTVNIEQGGQSQSFSATITLPAGQGPFPAVISFSGSGPTQQIAGMGVAVINFSQSSVGNRNSGIFGTLYPGNSAGDLVAWAWGASRIVDVLQAADNTIIDSKRLAVTGCSFLGKAAFATGALDERFVLTIPLESGIGGVPSYKIVPQLEPNPTGAGDGPEQPQHAINNGWLPGTALVASSQQLPVDTHEIIGLIAPRGLLVLGNTGTQGQYYKNLDFRSEHATAVAGKEIYTALGAADRMSYDSRAVNHCQNTDRFTAAVQASVGRFLLGNDSATGTFTTDWPDVQVAPDQWKDWTTPTLEGDLP